MCSVALEKLFMCHVVHYTGDLILLKTSPEENSFFCGVWVFGGGGGVFGEFCWFFLN